MKIDKDIVKHVSLLARLTLTDTEISQYSTQLGSILTYISKLNQIDTEGVLPTNHAVSTLKNVYRKDTLKKSLAVDEALSNAPAREGDFFKVPQVIEGK